MTFSFLEGRAISNKFELVCAAAECDSNMISIMKTSKGIE